MKFLSALFLGLILFSSCKKNRESEPVTFNGQITDAVTGNTVAGVTVKIKVQQSADNGIFNSTFFTAGSGTTDANGNYSITFIPESVVTYRIQLEKNLYFSTETDISASEVSAGSTTTRNFNFDPKGWFRINIKNVNPEDANDNILYQNTSEGSGCTACCNNSAISLDGMNIDTFFICQRVAYSSITFNWFVTRDGNMLPFSGSTTGIHGDTVVYNLNY